MRLSLINFAYALVHPWQTLQYLRRRDTIPEACVAQYLPSNPIILEAGAHNGADTLQMAAFWPEAQIHAFEPVPDAYNALLTRATKYPERIHCYPLGLGPRKGTMVMHISGDGSAGSCQSSSLLPPSQSHTAEYSFVSFGKRMSIEVTSIDEWAQKQGIDRVDFMRLDMQGYEIEALKGAECTLKRTSAIQLEVSHIQLYQGAPLYAEVKDWMARLGFRPAIKAVFRVGGNVLFVR
jgi:FkbM family methyltransferase